MEKARNPLQCRQMRFQKQEVTLDQKRRRKIPTSLSNQHKSSSVCNNLIINQSTVIEN